ncbi:transient receptor potential cation channel subfamily M member 5-like isoform X2 [Biomphalaria glabrata]|uniref:Transient receptor potential cation channel subfamily M member 5-like isoform X2 n=1 Tax=Biomphalaria glabrata TaxID=6526 RepID=A0A9W2YCR7_BIOGL|nr:transient receptor potential cation channel subfamily M member 5-like isoform X2 [Biomphalaria glabrata]
MERSNSKGSLTFPRLSRNQVSPDLDFIQEKADFKKVQKDTDDNFITLANGSNIYQCVLPHPTENETGQDEDKALQSEHVSHIIQRKWNFPKNPKLIIRLVGSFETEDRAKGKMFSIRDFLSQLIQLTVKEELWLIIEGEDSSLFKSLGNLLQSITLPTSDYSPAVVGIVTLPESELHLHENNDLNQSLTPNIKNYILTHPAMRASIRKKEWLECTILCNGTSKSVEEIAKCIQNKTPLIILKGSGGLSDVMAEILEIQSVVNQKSSLKYCVESLLDKVNCTQDKLQELTEQLVNTKCAYHILDIKNTLSQSVLAESILTAMHESSVELNTFLMLSLHFDQLDLAAELGQLWKLVDDNNYETCRMIIVEALELKRYNFVRYMIEQGLDPVHYIQEQDITRKYLLAVQREITSRDPFSEVNVSCSCSGRQAVNGSASVSSNESSMSKINPKKAKKTDLLIQWIRDYCGQKRIYTEDYKIERLFKLAILKKKFELSEIFWRYVKYPIGGALFACMLLRAMLAKEKKVEDIQRIKQQKKKYQQFALKTLNNTYSKYQEDAILLLSQTMPQWKDMSCVELALQMKNRDFLAHKACQELNNRLWRNSNISYQNKEQLENPKKLSCMERLVSPRAKAFMALFGHICFLVVYAVLLVSFLESGSFHVLEWIVWAFIVSFSLELIRQLYTERIETFQLLQISAVLLFVVGFFMKVGAYYDHDNSRWMEGSRVILSVDYILFCFGILEFYYIFKFLGPLLLTIKNMTKIFLKFVLIIMVFYVAFAVASESVLYPVAKPNGKLVYFINTRPFWSIFGEYGFDELDVSNDSCTDDPSVYNTYTKTRCPTESGTYYVPILMAFYVVLVNILLLNFLIAAFNSAIEKTEKGSYKIWCYQNFQFTLKYRSVLFLPPPFIVLFPFFVCCRREEGNQIFTQNEIRDDYEAMKLRRIQTEQRDVILKDLAIKNPPPPRHTENEITCPHKDVGEIGLDLMLKLKRKIKRELRNVKSELSEMQKALLSLGHSPNSTFTMDEDEFDGNDVTIYSGTPEMSQVEMSTQSGPMTETASDTLFMSDQDLNDKQDELLQEKHAEDMQETQAQGSGSTEMKAEIAADRDPVWIPKYGSIVAHRLAPEAEAILRKKGSAKSNRKYFACRTNYRYGVRWKIISVRRKTKRNGKELPISASRAKPLRNSLSQAINPDLKLI